jgi:hypothetical protein
MLLLVSIKNLQASHLDYSVMVACTLMFVKQSVSFTLMTGLMTKKYNILL